MKTTIIIPTLNEVESIQGVLNEIPEGVADEILIIDGHSNDGTVELVRKLGHRAVFQEKKGFGSAIAEGIEHSHGDVVVVLNADGSQNAKHIPLLLDKINEGCDLVLASRYLPGSGSEDDTLLHFVGNKIFTWLCNALYGVGISDSLYFFLAVRKQAFKTMKPLKSPNAGYCIELPIQIHKAGLKIGEIPSFERKRTGGKAKVNAFSAGFKILLTLLKQ